MDKLIQCEVKDRQGNQCSKWSGHEGRHVIVNRNKLLKTEQCNAVDVHGVRCTLNKGHARRHGSQYGFIDEPMDQILGASGREKDKGETIEPLSDARIMELEDITRYPAYVVSMAREIRLKRGNDAL